MERDDHSPRLSDTPTNADEQNTESELSRRQFLRTAGLLGAGIALAGRAAAQAGGNNSGSPQAGDSQASGQMSGGQQGGQSQTPPSGTEDTGPTRSSRRTTGRARQPEQRLLGPERCPRRLPDRRGRNPAPAAGQDRHDRFRPGPGRAPPR